MKPVILRETADRQNALLWSVRNLAGSRRDSISHRSKRTGISEGAVKYMEDLYGISIIQGLGALAESGNSRMNHGNRQRMRAIRVWKNWMIC